MEGAWHTEVARLSGQLQQCQRGNQPRAPTCMLCPASTQTQRSSYFLNDAGWHRCNFMFRALNYAPPGIVVIFIAWPYYTYTFINCKILLEDDVGSALHVYRVFTCLRTADPWTILRLRVPHSHPHLHVLPDLEFRPEYHGRSWSSARMGSCSPVALLAPDSWMQYARLEMERQGMHIPGKYLDINPEDKEKYTTPPLRRPCIAL